MESKSTKPRKGRRGRDVALSRINGSVPRDIADPAFMTEIELQRREVFAQAYFAHGTRRAAAEAAGFKGSKHVLTVTGGKLLQEPAVRARVEEIARDRCQELGITSTAVLAEMKRIAFFDIGKCFNENGFMKAVPDMDEDTRRGLAAYEIETKTLGSGEDAMEVENRKIKAFNKLDALYKLGNYLGVFKDPNDPARGGGITPEEFMRRMLAAREQELTMRKAIEQSIVSNQ